MVTYINTNQDILHRRRHQRPDGRDHPNSTPRLDDDADELCLGGAEGVKRIYEDLLVAGRKLAGRGESRVGSGKESGLNHWDEEGYGYFCHGRVEKLE